MRAPEITNSTEGCTPNSNKRIIITGAPGTGKTTLITALRSHGLSCMPEPAREIIAEQRAIDGHGVWERDTRLFLELLLSRAIVQFKTATNVAEDSNGVIYFDRGIPDCLAYAASAKMVLPHFERAASSYRYESKVWLLSPWEEIYEQDSERRMSFADTCQFHEILVKEYARIGYAVQEIERGSVDERVKTVLEKLQRSSGGNLRPNNR